MLWSDAKTGGRICAAQPWCGICHIARGSSEVQSSDQSKHPLAPLRKTKLKTIGGVMITLRKTLMAAALLAAAAAANAATDYPTGYTKCAKDGETCSFSGTRSVAYGKSGTFVYATLTGPITCSASLFPSTSVDNPRYCSYSGTASSSSSPSSSTSSGGTTTGPSACAPAPATLRHRCGGATPAAVPEPGGLPGYGLRSRRSRPHRKSRKQRSQPHRHRPEERHHLLVLDQEHGQQRSHELQRRICHTERRHVEQLLARPRAAAAASRAPRAHRPAA